MWILSGCDPQENSGGGGEAVAGNLNAEEQAAAAKLRKSEDPILKEISDYGWKTRSAYNKSNFDELEKISAEALDSKACFGNGSWKIFQFHGALACRSDEPESMWELHDRIHEAWIAAKPESITARVAHADFYREYAWHARGSGYANSVAPRDWKKFEIRLGKAAQILEKAKALPMKDPYYWNVALTIGMGQGWDQAAFDATVAEAVAHEPKFFAYDVTRSTTLLPRWHGEPGDWEAYALEAAKRPGGLGDEVYARIVMHMLGYHDHVFRDSKASWPKTKEGLKLMRERYPDSIEILSMLAYMGTIAEDREFAKAAFDSLGDTYFDSVWDGPGQFVHCRRWAETGEW